jgi:hypothetical protein
VSIRTVQSVSNLEQVARKLLPLHYRQLDLRLLADNGRDARSEHGITEGSQAEYKITGSALLAEEEDRYVTAARRGLQTLRRHP